MRIHAPLLPLTICLMVGILLANVVGQWPTMLAVLSVAVVVTSLLGRWPRCQTAGIAVCCLLLGMTLGARKRQQLEVTWPKERIDVEVVVVSEPVVKGRWVVADVLTASGGHQLRCRLACDSLSRSVAVGDGLLLEAIFINKVRAWENHHFNYQRFMQCHGFVGETFADDGHWHWQRVTLDGLSLLQRARLRFLCWRHQLLKGYRQWGFEDNAYGVIAAMTLGEKSLIDRELRDTYSKVGASHILALSGLHLMIIYGVISLLVAWRRFRMVSQVLIVLAIWAFAFLVGLSPSVTRSAIMISIYALLSLGYRDRMSVNTLAFAAIAMLVANPYALYDMGFQLSLMAVFAILLFTPLFRQLIPLHVQQRHRWLRILWGLTTVSVSAQLGTAPLVAYYFGYFSTYFLLTNYMVIPLATVVLYLALACAVLCWWPLAVGWVAGALLWTVTLMNSLMSWVGTLPWCSIEGIQLSALQVFLLYVLMGSAWVFMSLRRPGFR